MELCLVHANCQGEPLIGLLMAHPGFRARWRCLLVTNYTRETVPEGALAACTLFLHQHLGPQWGELSSEALRERLNPSARAVAISNMFFKGYWPLWTSAPDFNYSDLLLDALLARGLSAAETLHLFLRTDPARYFDLDALAAASLDHERSKETQSDVPYLDYLLARWKESQLFFTINHPRKELLAHAANGVLSLLGLTPLTPEQIADVPEELDEISLPIHPAIAARLGLTFADANTRYRVYGQDMTFAEYATHYVRCKLLGEKDFTGYLRLMAGQGGKIVADVTK